MSAKSEIEDKFLALWREWDLGPDPVRNYKFMLPERRLEMDYAWPDIKLGVELQGGIYTQGRSGHSSIPGLKRDMEKVNLAQLRGWVLLQIEPGYLTKSRQPALLELLVEAGQYQVSRKALDVRSIESQASVPKVQKHRRIPTRKASAGDEVVHVERPLRLEKTPIRFSTILHIRRRIRENENSLRRFLRSCRRLRS